MISYGSLGIAPHTLVQWLSLVRPEEEYGNYPDWILPIPARVSIIFLMDIYLLRRQRMAAYIKGNKGFPVAVGLLKGIEVDMKLIRPLATGKKRYECGGDTRVIMLQSGQVLRGWVNFALFFANET